MAFVESSEEVNGGAYYNGRQMEPLIQFIAGAVSVAIGVALAGILVGLGVGFYLFRKSHLP